MPKFFASLRRLVRSLTTRRSKSVKLLPAPSPRTRVWRAGPSVRRAPPTVLREVGENEILDEIRMGRVYSAMRLYQEKTGVNWEEAGERVGALQKRLMSS